MKRKVFLGYWYYFFGGIILAFVSIGLVVFEIAQLITVPKEVNPTITVLYWMLPLTFLGAVFMTCMMGFFMIQFTIMTEEGIEARCLWRRIRKLKWEEVKEVRYERFYVSVQGAFSSGWYVFDDGLERSQANGLMGKTTNITLPATKRVRKAINQFYKGEVIERVVK